MKENYQIGAGEFKTHCLKLIDRVNQTKQPIIITHTGQNITVKSRLTQIAIASIVKIAVSL
jgi:PHD/YefM family antitoxin component YafN of YafNO toxin-antitoxin module